MTTMYYIVSKDLNRIFDQKSRIVDREDENNTVAILVQEKDKCYILITFEIISLYNIDFSGIRIVDRNVSK